MLQNAADYCRKLTKRSRSNFYYAFLFLPRERREALYAVYAFCRLVDDAADDARSPEEARTNLARWRGELEAVYGDASPTHEVTTQLRDAAKRFAIRRADLEAVIEGCEWDATRTRYATWDDLRAYCYRVASAVGLMCIEIFGYQSPRAREYAIDLGLALQLTNILRDVAEDAGRGRLYLPLEDLAAFGVDEADLLAGRRTPACDRLLRFEAQRARGLYLQARAAIGEEEKARLVVAEIMGDIYYHLLCDLEEKNFSAGTVLPPIEKIAIALKRYLKARLPRPLPA
ncbi:MAG: squalene synthase HpnD [Myxococcales bacterium]|nr:squalene synthase HpnD [Myxococcales bacterium]